MRKLTFPVFSLCHFSKASLVAQSVKNQTAMQKTQILFLGQEDPLGRKCKHTPVFLPEESHGQLSLAGYAVHSVSRVRYNLVTKPLPSSHFK